MASILSIAGRKKGAASRACRPGLKGVSCKHQIQDIRMPDRALIRVWALVAHYQATVTIQTKNPALLSAGCDGRIWQVGWRPRRLWDRSNALWIAYMRMPLRVRIDRSLRVREGVAAEFMPHLADEDVAIAARVRSVIDYSRTSECEMPNFRQRWIERCRFDCHVLLSCVSSQPDGAAAMSG